MSANSTILIIDDEPALRMGLAAKIKRQGYEVLTASDGAEGLQMAKTNLPDLILSDVMMPPPNGFELRRILSQDPQLASIPFIFLTARGSVNDRVSGIREGADDYIAKPFVADELMARVEAVLRRVKVEQARGREEAQANANQEMERLKQEILQNFQHEIRTPLANIIMPLELFINNKFDDPDEQARFIRSALNNVDRLESLVTDFMVLTNIDHGTLNRIRQSVDVKNHILLPVQKRLERYKSKNLDFVTDIKINDEISAPRREFSHALVHLVDNAFKFSPEGGKITLFVESTLNGGARIVVQDMGPGIPPELYEKVFERNYQISRGDDRKHEGLGVGLTIAQAIFTNLGGSVRFFDAPTGFCVEAVLPGEGPEDISYG